MKTVLMSVVAGLCLSGCVTPNMEYHPENKPEYQKITPEEKERRAQSCREDPYQTMCQS